MENQLLIVFVTYNPPLDFLSNLDRLYKSYSIMVVDNSSNKPVWLDEYCLSKNIKCIFNNCNLGVAKAFNMGCIYAIANNYTWVITMDQDSVLTQDIIKKMIVFAEKYSDIDEVAVISPRHLLKNKYTVKVPDETLEYSEGLYTMSSGNLVNLNIWTIVGGFDESLFIDMVDVDYYCKVILKKFKVITINALYFGHSLGDIDSVRMLWFRVNKLNHVGLRKYYQARNSLFVYTKYRKLVPQSRTVLMFFVILLITVFYEKNTLKKIFYILRGIIDFIRGKKGELT